MDIGCYPIQISRFLFEEEPVAFSAIRTRPRHAYRPAHLRRARFRTDQAIFTCSTQLVPYQRVQVLGTQARIDLEIPFNAPPDRPTSILIDSGKDIFGCGITVEEFDICDQYTLQGDQFSKAVRGQAECRRRWKIPWRIWL